MANPKKPHSEETGKRRTKKPKDGATKVEKASQRSQHLIGLAASMHSDALTRLAKR